MVVLTIWSALAQMVDGLDDAVADWSSILIGLAAPPVLASCVCSLLLTTHRLPAWRSSWFNKIARGLRRHPTVAKYTTDESATRRIRAGLPFFGSSLRLPFRRLAAEAEYGHDLASRKTNQFGRGEPNFNAMAIWLAFLPITIGVLAYLPSSIEYADEVAALQGSTRAAKLRVKAIASLFARASIVCLVFFLIPVTRHSVLLAAMGWSPIHALRIHVWLGCMAFVFMLIHAGLLVAVWLLHSEYPVKQQIVPDPKCWTLTWTGEAEKEYQPDCYHAFANSTGIVAAVSFIILWGSSLNWVRRRNYRLFYTLHVTFGTLTLLGTILHVHWYILYLIPSITCYLASTTPTLVQALASRFRGGVTIRKVVPVEDGGGCVEVHLEAHPTATAALSRDPCQFIKVCVPAISLIWHPFDVYKSYAADGEPDDDTVRFLFRPVGPFTKELAKRLASNAERPIMLVDGFYRGSDKVELAMQHDCVTMVAGGVGLSPYLTLIPALLRRIAQAEKAGDAKTTSIVLHWVCREPGLCSHYVENYLSSIVKRARALNLDASLAIFVYLTGGTKKVAAADLSETTTLEGSSRLTLGASPADDLADRSPHDAGVVDPESGSFSPRDSDVIVTVDAASTGHPLELARVLPRRHSSAIWNLPFFAYYSGVSFFGFWYLFNQDPREPTSYYDLSKMTWITVYAVLMYVAFGIAVEACVLAFRKYWPEPSPPDNGSDVVAAAATATATALPPKLELSESDDGSCGIEVVASSLESSHNRVTLAYREGRPTADQIFHDARSAAEPGIFTCGPLARMVRAEASKENSCLGLTRYCLYDEPYEM
jgi:predicted ferric reductase